MPEHLPGKLFLSCVTREFGSYRLTLYKHLRGLANAPDVKIQEDFQLGGYTLLERLADYIRECELVIHLVGDACGARPTQEHERALWRRLGEADSVPTPGLSYSQWEYELARRLARPVWVYDARTDAFRDCLLPVSQSDEDSALQQVHRQRLSDSGIHYREFGDPMDLLRKVFHDLGLEPDRKINNLPQGTLGSLFKGRDEFLDQIRESLSGIDSTGRRRAAAITASTAASVHGLGGIGKTRTAIEYGLGHADEYTALLFVRADSPQGLKEDLAGLCGPLVLNLPEREAMEVEVQVAAVLRWLQGHPGWFLIFDNVDSEEAAIAVEDLVGSLSGAGHLLITSRLSNWSNAVQSLALDVLTLDDAAQFLLDRTAGRRRIAGDDAERAKELAELLGQLALALEQAGAMICKSGFSFAEYFAQWKERHDQVLGWFDERLMHYPRSVAVTWKTSFDQLGGTARKLLGWLSWFAPDPIPLSLLDVPVPDEMTSSLEVRSAFSELESFSLATRSVELPEFSIHRLVQDVTRSQEKRYGSLLPALLWIDDAFSSDPEDVLTWPNLLPLAPHAYACADRADEHNINGPTARLMNSVAVLEMSRADFDPAERLFRRALRISQEGLGTDQTNVASALNNLASLLRDTNRLTEAEPLYRQALDIYLDGYGPYHPLVATALSNLARLFTASNRFTLAEPLFRRALEIFESFYGPSHPSVAIELSNLAGVLQATKRFAEAESLFRSALDLEEIRNGPSVATYLNNMAGLLLATDRLWEAEPLFSRALKIDEANLGPDHPNIARDLNNLAVILERTGRCAEAEPLFHRALGIQETKRGPQSPQVAIYLNNLAGLLISTSRLAEAEPFSRRHLKIFAEFNRATGHVHQHFEAAVNNYFGLLMEMGLTEEQADERVREILSETSTT